MTRGVIGNTSDFGSEESRFEPWRVNRSKPIIALMMGFLLLGSDVKNTYFNIYLNMY